MKVLAVHAFYRTPGGEDQSFRQDMDLLASMGATVNEVTVNNEDFTTRDMARARFLSNRAFVESIRDRLSSADLLWANNLWPAASPGVLSQAVKAGVPILQCVRNYRLICASATLRRDGKFCDDCIQRGSRLPAVKNRCYEGSAIGTVAVASAAARNLALFRRERVPWMLCPTSDQVAQHLVRSGLDERRIRVRRNFLAGGPAPRMSPGSGAVFVGRLSLEKGIGFLLDLWSADATLPTLHIYGDGPLRPMVQEAARSGRVIYHGAREPAEIFDAMASAAVCVVPSDWEEPFGRVAMESLAAGTPVLVSPNGALPRVVGDAGFALPLDRPDAWLAALHQLTGRTAQERYRPVARERFLTEFTPAVAESELRPILESLGVGSSR